MKYLFILLTLLFGVFAGAFSQAQEQNLEGLHSSKLYFWVQALEKAQWQEYEGELNFGYELNHI